MPYLRGRGFNEFDAFRRSFEKYFSDRFGFRDDLIRVHNLLHVRSLRTSPLASVVIGRNDWLYYNSAGELNLLDYCGLDPFFGKDLDALESSIISTHDALRRRGIAFAVLVAPSKHTIYPEYLPERIRVLAGATRLDQLAGRLSRRPDILFVDVRQALLEGKAQHPVYFRTDTHWNSYGAHLAARQLLASLERAGVAVAPPHDEDLLLELQDRPLSDLTKMLGLPGEGHEQDFLLRYPAAKEMTHPVPPLRKGLPPGRETITCETGKTGPRFLMVHDSFGTAITPSLCREFSYGASIWGSRVVDQNLEQERPDVVILEVAERSLGQLSHEAIFVRRD